MKKAERLEEAERTEILLPGEKTGEIRSEICMEELEDHIMQLWRLLVITVSLL